MAVIDQVLVEVSRFVVRQVSESASSQPSSLAPSTAAPTSTLSEPPSATATTIDNPSPTGNSGNNGGGGGGGGGNSSSPLLFFVALGFGVVFTNLWIIVGVKYCFRYNARNRAMRLNEDGEPINLENMPRPHRRRREKKLMTMDEVNDKFPMTKYKTWVGERAREGLPTAGASPLRRVVQTAFDLPTVSSPSCLQRNASLQMIALPLADYYTPKPRPTPGDGDPNATGDMGRTASRANMPNAPPAAWYNLTGNNLVFGRNRGNRTANSRSERRRRARQQATPASSTQNASQASPPVAENQESRGLLANIRLPAFRNPLRRGDNQQPGSPTASGANVTPSQLEAGTQTAPATSTTEAR
ncbi:RING-8 protein [Colletotrichum tofieldiae]|nr:RING-8 protein [Colletotrichum tofieldiae]